MTEEPTSLRHSSIPSEYCLNVLLKRVVVYDHRLQNFFSVLEPNMNTEFLNSLVLQFLMIKHGDFDFLILNIKTIGISRPTAPSS